MLKIVLTVAALSLSVPAFAQDRLPVQGNQVIDASEVNASIAATKQQCRVWLAANPPQDIKAIREDRALRYFYPAFAMARMSAYGASGLLVFTAASLPDSVRKKADAADASFSCLKLLNRWPASSTK